MHGDLPAPVAAMPEKKHGMFDGGLSDALTGIVATFAVIREVPLIRTGREVN